MITLIKSKFTLEQDWTLHGCYLSSRHKPEGLFHRSTRAYKYMQGVVFKDNISAAQKLLMLEMCHPDL